MCVIFDSLMLHLPANAAKFFSCRNFLDYFAFAAIRVSVPTILQWHSNGYIHALLNYLCTVSRYDVTSHYTYYRFAITSCNIIVTHAYIARAFVSRRSKVAFYHHVVALARNNLLIHR